MPLIDATSWFKDPAMDGSLRGQAFVRQFEGRVDSLRGVYVHLDMNVSDLPIYDKNGPGKLLVLGSTNLARPISSDELLEIVRPIAQRFIAT